MASGHDLTSAHRSLLRFLSTVLPDPWDVQPQRREPQTRPLCVAQPLNAMPSTGTAYVREYAAPFEILAYPPGVDADPFAAQVEARAILSDLLRSIDSGNGRSGRDRSYAMRLPHYDYAAVAPGAPVPVDAEPIGFMVVQALSGQVRQDAEQDDLWTVLIDLTLRWRDDGDLSRYDGAVLQGTTIGWRP